jgi:hypothetical protein
MSVVSALGSGSTEDSDRRTTQARARGATGRQLTSGNATAVGSLRRRCAAEHVGRATPRLGRPDHIPRVFRINVTANNANSVTYSVGYCLVR